MTKITNYISEVSAGWATLKIEDENTGLSFQGEISDIRDFPLEFLDAIKSYIDDDTIPTVLCDEEGSEFIIVMSEYNVYIIAEREKTEYYNFSIDRNEFILNMLDDFETFLQEFGEFGTTPEQDEIIDHKIEILCKIKDIRAELGE